MNRRRLLFSTGGLAGVLGLGGYHQRRRIKRWSDKEELNETRAMASPTPELTTNLTVTEPHLRDALEDLERIVGTARDAAAGLESGVVIHQTELSFEHSESVLEDAESQFAKFAELSKGERLALLEDLRSGLRSAGQQLALAKLARDEWTTDDIESELDAVEGDYETAGEDLEYYASDVSWAVVAYGELDEVLEDVQAAISTGRRNSSDRPPRAYSRVPYARGRLDDVNRFVEHLRRDAEESDAETMAAPLDDQYRTIREETETTLDETDFEYDDDVSTHAVEIWGEWISLTRSGGSDEYDDGRLALATRLAAERYATALSLEAFRDVPRVRGTDDSPVDDLDTRAADVRDAKRRAVDELDSQLDEVGDNSLVRFLCIQLVDDLEWRDRQIERTLEDINQASSQEWTISLEMLRRGYLEIAEIAAVVPDVLDLVEGQ